VVLGRSTVLAEQLAGTPHESALQKLRAAADRCGRIVRTFLAMARRSAPERSAVDINALVADALEITGYGLRTAGIDLVLDLDPALPRTSADGDQLVQVVINLLINAQHALAALPEGSPRRVRIATAHDDAAQKLLLTVADTGVGVPEAVRRRIFEPFFTTKSVGEGTGMGLSVSRGIVEAHGGTLDLLPGDGAGAAFRVSLPIEPVAPVRARRDPRREPGATQGRILIVDDEREVAELLEECLRPIGAGIRIANDGNTALAEIEAGWFDAVLCDLRMPGIDGFETRRRAASLRPGQEGRFLFLTGDILAGDTSRRAAEIGRPVIEKPFDPAEVRAAVEALLPADGAAETIETR
jgi:CheY-like chemotaxis protein/two-component sensor histidine kinase